MKKYQVYSGAKPSSADKTFAIYSGGKYFSFSPVKGKESLSKFTDLTATISGSTLSVNYTNSNKDSVEAYFPEYYYYDAINGSIDDKSTFAVGKSQIAGPLTKGSFAVDLSGVITKAGEWTVVAVCYPKSIYPYQTYSSGTGVGWVGAKKPYYKKFAPPSLSYTKSYGTLSDTTAASNVAGDYGSTSFTVTAKNNDSTAGYLYCYQSESSAGSVSTPTAGGGSKTGASWSETSVAPASRKYYSYIDCVGSSSDKTGAASAMSLIVASSPQGPAIVDIKPTSTTSTSFQVTVKNNNSKLYYCRASYRGISGASNSDYWAMKCPANGTGTLINTSGSAQTFTLTRGATYTMLFYFHTTANSYSGTIAAPMLKYTYKAPDSGYIYASPVYFNRTYPSTSTVKFDIYNPNGTSLYCNIDLYSGTSSSGTRVDYWYHQVGARSHALSNNSWSITKGNTYTMVAYFQTNSGYHGTAVSGKLSYIFTA